MVLVSLYACGRFLMVLVSLYVCGRFLVIGILVCLRSFLGDWYSCARFANSNKHL